MLLSVRSSMRFLKTAILFAIAAAAVSFAQNQANTAALTPQESRMAATIDANGAADRALLEQLVNINSGTMHLAGVVAVKDVLAPRFADAGFSCALGADGGGDRARGRSGRRASVSSGTGHCGKRLLLIGHMDTVFEPSSTFQHYAPLDSAGKAATGPGVADMKGGLVIMLSALNAMKQAGALNTAEIRIVLSGDEERAGDPLEKARHDLIEAAKAE